MLCAESAEGLTVFPARLTYCLSDYYQNFITNNVTPHYIDSCDIYL